MQLEIIRLPAKQSISKIVTTTIQAETGSVSKTKVVYKCYNINDQIIKRICTETKNGQNQTTLQISVHMIWQPKMYKTNEEQHNNKTQRLHEPD